MKRKYIIANRTRAFVKLFTNGDAQLRARNIMDDFRMLEAIFIHMEGEGYDMSRVRAAVSVAHIRKRPHDGRDAEVEG